MPLTISSVCRNITPSTTLRLNAMVAEKRKQGLDIVSLAAGEPDFDTPKNISEAAKRAIDEGRTKYTAVSGIPELRKALSAHIQTHRGLTYQPNEIIVGTGAKQVLLGALQAMLEPGDEVLLPAPCWLSYPEMVRMAGGVPVVVQATQAQGFVPDRAQLEAAITPRTRAIILNSPNNPTGVVWTRAQLEAVTDLAAKHDFAIISDEIYEELVFEGAAHHSPASFSEDAWGRTITVSGLSKTYAMTGWRLGYAAGPRDFIAAMDAYQSHATGNPNSIGQYAALEAVAGDQTSVQDMRAAFERRCRLFMRLLDDIPGITYATPHGAFYILVNVSALLGKQYGGHIIANDSDFAELLLEHALVSAVPGEPFYAPGCLRMSYATSDANLEKAAQRLKEFVGKLT